MSLFPVAGCKFYIGDTVMSDQAADFIASDFGAVSWTEIDGYTQMGTIGDAAAVITTSLINRGRDVKQKGTSNAGSRQDEFASIPTNAGQIALVAASAPTNKNNYPFRIDLNDQVAAGQPSKRYFIGVVASAQETGGEANTIRKLTSTIEVNSNIVKVAAT